MNVLILVTHTSAAYFIHSVTLRDVCDVLGADVTVALNVCLIYKGDNECEGYNRPNQGSDNTYIEGGDGDSIFERK